MVSLWRLTRNPYAKRLHAALDTVGLTVSVLQVYTRALDTHAEPATGRVRLRYHDPDVLTDSFRDADALDRADRVVAAYADGRRVGSVLTTVGETVYVDPLHREFDPGGAYVWRLYVAPDHRGERLGRLLVRAALRAATECGPAVDRASALVAADNVPSQRVFEAVGFEPTRELRYVRLPGVDHRSSRPLASAPEGNVEEST